VQTTIRGSRLQTRTRLSAKPIQTRITWSRPQGQICQNRQQASNPMLWRQSSPWFSPGGSRVRERIRFWSIRCNLAVKAQDWKELSKGIV